MNDQNKETAIQNEQQSNETQGILDELHELNKILKDISNTFTHISQYGINARIS